MRCKDIMTTFNRGSNSLYGIMIWVSIYIMGKSGHEYLTCTETAKSKTDFLLSYNQATSAFWFSIHDTILSLKYKADLIIRQPTAVAKMSLLVIT